MRPNVSLVSVLSAVCLASCLAGCTTYRDELVRAQGAYDANEHEMALAIERAIEPNAPYLRPAERTRYFYLRGMTDFRIGYRGEARHYLAIARAMEEENPGALPADWKNRLTETLSTLNTEVYSSGLASLSAHEAEASTKKSKKK
jgi:hypothetical protein